MRRHFIMIRPDICCTQTQWNMVTCRQYVWSLVQRHSSTSRKIIGNYLLYLHIDKIFINYFLLIHPISSVVFMPHWTRVWLVCVTWSEHCAVSRPLPLVKRWRHCPGCWATGDHLSPAPRPIIPLLAPAHHQTGFWRWPGSIIQHQGNTGQSTLPWLQNIQKILMYLPWRSG